MSTNRRNVLTLLGLVGSGSVALATEKMVDADPKARLVTGRDGSPDKIARALRLLATAIEQGEVEIFGLKIETSLEPNTVLAQTLMVKFALDASEGMANADR